MRCEDVCERLVEYLDGGGIPGGRGIADHLAGCAACRREYDALRDTLRLVNGVRVEDPGAEFWRRNRDAIRAAVARSGGRRPGHGLLRLLAGMSRRLEGAGGPAAAVLAALLLVAAALTLQDVRTSDREPSVARIVASDREALGEAYVEGVLFPGGRAAEELAWLSEADIAAVVRVIDGLGEERAPARGKMGIQPGWRGLEEEIRGLGAEQLDRLMENLTTPPARG